MTDSQEMHMLNQVAAVLLGRALAIFLVFGALSGIGLGVVLIFKSQWLAPLGRVANRWISVRYLTAWLDRSVSLEHWFYRYHKGVGIAVVLGAAYIFCYFALVFDKSELMRQMGGMWLTRQAGGLLDAMVLTALIGSAASLLVGLFLWLRPSGLRDIEKQSNTWVSSRRATKLLDEPHPQLDRYVMRHAKGAGWLLLLASLGLLLILLRLWF
jgi:hypothetical protein